MSPDNGTGESSANDLPVSLLCLRAGELQDLVFGAGRNSEKESSVEVMTLCHSETFKRTEHNASQPVDGQGVFGSAPKSPCKFRESECNLTDRNFQVHDCRHPRRSS